MKISTEIDSIALNIGQEKAVQLVGEAGFDAWDFSLFNMAKMDWSTRRICDTDHPLRVGDPLKVARTLKHIGEECGIHCNQSHAPFPVSIPEIRSTLKRAIECTAEAGGKICIIHPDNNKSAKENAEMYFELLPFAKDCGVKIATENMWNWYKGDEHCSPAACSSPEDFLAHLNAVNDPYFVACLDIGHAQMRGLNTSAPEMIHALGTHLQALHIHDNDCLHDSHAMPFTMQIDFSAVVNALRDINYSGYFTLEADRHCHDCDAESLPDKVKELAHSAKCLADMFEQK